MCLRFLFLCDSHVLFVPSEPSVHVKYIGVARESRIYFVNHVFIL